MPWNSFKIHFFRTTDCLVKSFVISSGEKMLGESSKLIYTWKLQTKRTWQSPVAHKWFICLTFILDIDAR